MDYVTSEELVGKAANKYEAVVVAALRARQLNLLEKKKRETQGGAEVVEEREGEEKAKEKEKKRKVTVIALNELVEGKIKFQKEEG